MNQWTPSTVLIVGGVAVLGAWYLKNKAVETVKDAGQAVNPVNPDNIFNRGAQSIWDQFTDGEGTIGTDTADAVMAVKDWWKELTGSDDLKGDG